VNVVLDASAIVAFLRSEPGAEIVKELLIVDPPRCMVHAVNLCEVYYGFLSRSDEAAAALAIETVRSIGVIVREDMDDAFWQQAGRYKARFRIPLADAFALSLADRFGAEVVTSDRGDFEPIAESGAYRVTFIR
jgi:PIN domain nuclease of toxin-antitoxin system